MRKYLIYPLGLLVLNLIFGLAVALRITASGISLDENNTLAFGVQAVTGPYQHDSSQPVEEAWKLLQQEHTASSIYQDLLIREHLKFQYPPTILLLPQALDRRGADYYGFFTSATLVFLGVTILGISGIVLHWYGRIVPRRLSAIEIIVLCSAFVALTLTFYPIAVASTLGQIQVWLDALFALSLWFYLRGQDAPAGVMLGLMASLKPQYGLFLLWGIIRGNRSLVIAMLVSVAAGLVVGLMQFGPTPYLDYLKWLSFLSRRGESYYPNQSINGLLGRILSVHNPEYNDLVWSESYPPYNAGIYYSTLLSGILVMTLSLLKGKNRQDYGRYSDYCIMALGITIASPIAWEHHYGILLAIFAFLLPAVWFNSASSRTLRVLLIAGYLVSGNLIYAANALAPTYLNFVQSYLWFAAVGVFAMLLKIRHSSLEGASP